MRSGAASGSGSSNAGAFPAVVPGQGREDYRERHGDDAYYAACMAGAFSRPAEEELRLRRDAYRFATGTTPPERQVARWHDELGIRRRAPRNSCHRGTRPGRTRRPRSRAGRTQRATRGDPDGEPPPLTACRRRGAGWEALGVVELLLLRCVCGRRTRRP